MPSPFARLAGCVVALLAAPPLAAQTGGAGVEPARLLLEDPNLPRDIDPAPPRPAAPDPPPLAGTAAALTDPPNAALTDFRLSQTYLPRFGRTGFGNHDTDLAAQFAFPGWDPLGKPLLLKGGVGVHAWDGPAADPGLPGAVYDFYLDLGWKPRPAEWLFLDLGLTPGLYTDLRAFPHEAFRPRGRGLAVVALSERLQFVGGVLYVNRNGTKVIPAGGVLWTPDEATRCQLVFPQPKAARRLASRGGAEWWVYLAGEFGGGTWAYERPDGSTNSVDLNDYRVILGGELKRAYGWALRAEAGYVWGRELVPLNAPRVTPADTLMARLALVY